MPGLPPGSSVAGGPSIAGASARLIYGKEFVETTLSGDHAAMAAEITLASIAGIEAGMYAGIAEAGVGLETHRIAAVDANANQVTIAAPGLSADRPDGAGVTAAAMFGAESYLQLPAPRGAAAYDTLEVRAWGQLPGLNGNAPFYHNASHGQYGRPGAGAYKTHTRYGAWYTEIETDPAEAQIVVGAVHASNSLSNFWRLCYEPASNRLVFVPADDTASVSYAPLMSAIVVVGSP